MNKTLLALSITALLPFNMNARSNPFYYRFGGSFNMPVARQPFEYNNYLLNVNTLKYTEKITKYSNGHGFRASAALGKMFSANVGFELGLDYLFALPYSAEQLEVAHPKSSMHTMVERTSRNLNLTPAIKLVLPIGSTGSFYSRTGLVLPLIAKTTDNFVISNQDTMLRRSDITLTQTVSTKPDIGYNQSLGFEKKLKGNVYFWVEANLLMLNVWAKKAEVTHYTLNGKDGMPMLQFADLYTIYRTEIHEYSNYGQRSTMEGDALTYKLPFHSLGIALGIKVNL